MVNPRSCLVTFFILLLLASIASIFFEYDQVKMSTQASVNLDFRTDLPHLRWLDGELDISKEDIKLDSDTVSKLIAIKNNKKINVENAKHAAKENAITNVENGMKNAKDIIIENALRNAEQTITEHVSANAKKNTNKSDIESSIKSDKENSKKKDTTKIVMQSATTNTIKHDPVSAKRRARMRSRNRSEELKGHLRDACDMLNISLDMSQEMLRHMLIDEKRKVMYCYVPKVACTSWKRIWMRLTGLVNKEEDINKIERHIVHKAKIPSLYGKPSAHIYNVLKSYKKYMFVRHPFERALSAYKDKFEHEEEKSNYSFHKDIGVKIKSKYNPGYKGNGDGVTFTEFIDYITDDEHEISLTTGQRNEHWLSVHDLCNPCYVQYDFIGKYETLKEDADYVLDWMNVADLPLGFPVADRPCHAKRYDPEYFKQLNHNLRMAFLKKYVEDFVAFNYTFV